MQSERVAKPLHEQLRAAFDGRDPRLTMTELLSMSGLEVDESSLGRKLNGKQLMRTEECEAIARALGVTVVYGEEEGTAA